MKSRREEIITFAKSLACLPSLDAMVGQLSSLVNDPSISFPRLSKVVQYDPGLSSKIISASNSAWHNRGTPVVTLSRAMTVLGLEEVKNIITCTLFYDGIMKKMGVKKSVVVEVWKHSLLVAFAAKILSKERGENSEEGFTAGLLHDIGKVPLLIKPEYLVKTDIRKWHNLCGEERERLGTDHAEVGFYMAIEWKFPEDFRNAIKLHHNDKPDMALVTTIRDADSLVCFDADDFHHTAIKTEIEKEAKKIFHLFAD